MPTIYMGGLQIIGDYDSEISCCHFCYTYIPQLMEHVVGFSDTHVILTTFLAKNNFSTTFQGIPMHKIKLF